jgi:hypothetical protein
LELIRRDQIGSKKEDFSFKFSEKLVTAFDYEIVRAKHKHSNKKLYAKILDKEKVDILDREESLKNEILLNKNMVGNGFLVNMHSTFESKKHLYIMYERFDKNCPPIDHFKSNKMKQFFILRVLIALIEINSQGMCISHFTLQNIVVGGVEDYKIFNTDFLTVYGKQSEVKEDNYNEFTPPEVKLNR